MSVNVQFVYLYPFVIICFFVFFLDLELKDDSGDDIIIILLSSAMTFLSLRLLFVVDALELPRESKYSRLNGLL